MIHRLLNAATIAIAVVAPAATGALAQSGLALITDPAVVGQWSAPIGLPIVAVSTALVHTGDVLMWDETGGGDTFLWRPSSGAFTRVPNAANQFCSGQVTLADGRVFLQGGGETPAVAIPSAASFIPATSSWTAAPPMAYDRWYPTGTTLSDGRVLVTSGTGRCFCQVSTPEIFDPLTNTWSRLPGADLVMPNYPFMFQLPDGRVLYAGSHAADTDTRALDVAAQTWTMIDPVIVAGGSAAMYRPGLVIKSGKSTESHPPAESAVGLTYVIDMNKPQPSWRQVGSMAFPRAYHTLTILPDGTVAATGGLGTTDFIAESQAVLAAEIWNPADETWSTMAGMQTPRSYHSTGLLLPDGRVLVAGSGRAGTLTNRLNAEIFSPPYLFKGPRPTLTAVQGVVGYGGTVFVATPDVASIASVSLVRPGAVTHTFDQNQRFVPVPFTPATGGLTLQLPANANIAPPGYYMLFLVNSAGVPSVATFVRFPAASEAPPPPGSSEIIIDNATPGVQDGGRTFTGSWCMSPPSNKFGADALHNCFGALPATYRWTPTIPTAGAWDVYVWWDAQAFQAASVPITVVSASGPSTRAFNESTGGGQWVLHGRYNFSAGIAGYVQVSNNGSGHVAADAVRFVPVPGGSPLPAVAVSATIPFAGEAGLRPGEFTFTRTGSTAAPLSVSYTVSGTASPGSDYATLPGAGIINIPVGAASVSLAVRPMDDALVEPDETVIVSLAASSAYSVGTPGSATVTISSDDIAASEIIIDNAPAGVQGGGRTFTGAWCTSPPSNKFGANALHNCFGAVAATYRWTPTIPTAGAWDVYVWWDAQSFQSTSVPITVVSASGSATQTFNEQSGGGQWVLHGRYNFSAGTAGYVQVGNPGVSHVSADAVRFVRVP